MLRSTSASMICLSATTSTFRGLYVRPQIICRRNVSRWTPQTSLQTALAHRNTLLRPVRHELRAAFHTTPPRQHPLFYALLASVFKASGSIEVARMITKVLLTFVPLVALKNIWARKYLKHVAKDKPEHAHKRSMVERNMRKYTISYRALIAIPLVFVGLTFIASLERTPLSGRWRVILLSPEEEDSILKQLQGDGWYRAVLEVISQDGTPEIIPHTDWRHQVVEAVLRRLERTIPVLAAERYIDLPWLERAPDDVPFPPPAKYPLKPRPSAKEYLRWFCDNVCESRKSHEAVDETIDSPHLIPGPPYNLIVVDRPDCDNAFSFGFGPDGGGGIVVYSGFLNRVFGEEHADVADITPANARQPPPSRSMVSELMGSLLAFSPPPSSIPRVNQHIVLPPREPTDEQITQLAILLAHELSHLILAHHLESLSSGTVFIPGTVSIFSDLLRAVLFPVTMIFGPFVNDAVANLGKYGAGEFAKLSESCTSMSLEFEADAVSARILAHAGFDARETISFWEQRRDASFTECSPSQAAENRKLRDDSLVVTALQDGDMSSLGVRLARRIMGTTHPAHEARLLRLKSELQRWDTERARALKKKARKLKKEMQKSE